MTGDEWLACSDPEIMFEVLRDKASDRKLRFASGQFCLSYIRLFSPWLPWGEMTLGTLESAKYSSENGARYEDLRVDPESDDLPCILIHENAYAAARGTWAALTRLIRNAIFNRNYVEAEFNAGATFRY